MNITIVLCIVVCIICLYLLTRYLRSDKHRRAKSEELYQQSRGDFDTQARQSLEELRKIDNPGPRDYFRRGNIVEYNVLQGTIRKRGENRNQIERVAVGNIAHDYTQAIAGMRDVIDADITIDPVFMMDRIGGFGNVVIRAGDPDLLNELNMFFVALEEIGPLRQDLIEDRQMRTRAAAGTKEEAAGMFLDDATNYTSDPQNVHDTKVNNDLRATLYSIRGGAEMNPAACIAEARAFIDAKCAEQADKRRAALRTLETVALGGHIDTFDMTEDQIFGLVWTRAKHPRNAPNADLIKEAIVNSLADCIENDAIVCINGRCSRIINSLALVDFNEDVGHVMTYEAYKNQIYGETRDIIARAVDQAKSSPAALLRAVGESWSGADIVADPVVEQHFVEGIKDEINRNLGNYASKLTPDEITNIRLECYAAVDF